MFKAVFLLVMLASTAALADEDYGNVDLLTGYRLPDGSYEAAIVFDLKDGWKTYWRVPGPVGLPTSFNWSGSSNIAAINIQWPAPHVFQSFGAYSFGYKGRAVIPVHITPADPSKPIGIDLKLGFGVCSDICMPATAVLEKTLQADLPASGVGEIKSALNAGATSGRESGIASIVCAFTPTSAGMNIRTDLNFTDMPDDDQVVVMEYDDPDVWIDVATLSGAGRAITASSRLEFYGSGMLALDRSKLRLTVLSNGKAAEVIGCPSKG